MCVFRTLLARSATGRSPQLTTGEPWASSSCMTSPTTSPSTPSKTGEGCLSMHVCVHEGENLRTYNLIYLLLFRFPVICDHDPPTNHKNQTQVLQIIHLCSIVSLFKSAFCFVKPNVCITTGSDVGQT